MNRNMTIGLDLGTGAVKGVLWDGRETVARDSFDVVCRHEGGRVEIEPLSYWEEVLALLRRLALPSPGPVAAVCICAASGNAMAYTRDGTPLTGIISWLDPVTADPPDALVHEVTGWPWCGGFPYAHIQRMRRERPELFRTGVCFGMNNDWIQFRLCGQRFLDYSSATPFYLQDQRVFKYHPPYLERLGLTAEQLPRLVASGQVMGRLRPEIAVGNLTVATVLASGSFDHPAAARACGVTHPGELLLSCGTSWVGFTPAPARKIRPGVLFDPFLSPEGGPWGEMVSLEGVGRELEEYIVQHFSSAPDRYRRFGADAAAGGPAAEIMRQTVRRFWQLLSENRIKPEKAVMVGGPAESEPWRKITAEELDCRLESSPFGKYAAAAGAAVMADRALTQSRKENNL